MLLPLLVLPTACPGCSRTTTGQREQSTIGWFKRQSRRPSRCGLPAVLRGHVCLQWAEIRMMASVMPPRTPFLHLPCVEAACAQAAWPVTTLLCLAGAGGARQAALHVYWLHRVAHVPLAGQQGHHPHPGALMWRKPKVQWMAKLPMLRQEQCSGRPDVREAARCQQRRVAHCCFSLGQPGLTACPALPCPSSTHQSGRRR